MSQLSLILASGSPQRRRLLSDAGYVFHVIKPDDTAECGICGNTGPAELVVELATRKAAVVLNNLTSDSSEYANCLLIACDTVAECDGQILGKPRDEDHARLMLQALRGKKHRVYSGLCLWPWQKDGLPEGPQTNLAVSELEMDRISDADLEDYLATGLWQDKAGAFGLQDRPGWLRIHLGSESNVIGLPMELLEKMLAPWKTCLTRH